jgi:hypothetical protein
MASALFSVEGSTAQIAHEVDFGETINYALANTAGVNTVTYTVIGLSHAGLSIPAVTMAASPIGTGSHAMPAAPSPVADRSFIIECVVNGGYDANGRADPTLRCRRLVGTKTYSDVVPIAAGETTERDATVGWVAAFNKPKRFSGSATLGVGSAWVTLITVPIPATSGGLWILDYSVLISNPPPFSYEEGSVTVDNYGSATIRASSLPFSFAGIQAVASGTNVLIQAQEIGTGTTASATASLRQI